MVFLLDLLVILCVAAIVVLTIAFLKAYWSNRIVVDDFDDYTGLGVGKLGSDSFIFTFDSVRRVLQRETEFTMGEGIPIERELHAVRPILPETEQMISQLPSVKGVQVGKVAKFLYNLASLRAPHIRGSIFKTADGIECRATYTRIGGTEYVWREKVSAAQISAGDAASASGGIAFQALYSLSNQEQRNMSAIDVRVPGQKSAPELPEALRFTSWESFRSFTEALEALQAYESTSNPDKLSEAAKRFEKFTKDYPQELIGLYYLGLIREMQGLGTVPESVKIFRQIREAGPPELALPASYNLGLALLEEYEIDSINQAIEELERVIVGIDSALQQEVSKRSQIQYRTLRTRALSVLSHCYVELINLRWKSMNVQGAEQMKGEALSKLAQAEELLKEIAPEIPQPLRDEITLMIHNTRGTLALYMPRFFEDEGRKQLDEEAEREFRSVLGINPSWIDSLSNLGVLYREQNKFADAEATFDRVLKLRPGDEYSYYNLGLIYRREGLCDKAREAFAKAPDIRDALEQLKELDGH